MATDDETTLAPYGRDDDGKPKAPYGYKADGSPARKVGRPSKAGGGATRPRRRAVRPPVKRSDAQTREMLVSLSDVLVVPLASAARSELVVKRIGDQQAMALSGDAVIVQSFVPHFADGLIAYAQVRPGVLAWMDTMEEKAPVLALLQVGAQFVKALVSNHMSPDPRLAQAGQTLAAMRTAQLADAIEREAAAMGVSAPGFAAQPEGAAA